ncbi:MAG TPA: CDP-diacylglycerol--serine O-phosphatidyltransferase [Vicinamibacterales bacterium]
MMLRVLRKRRVEEARFRRGAYLLPSLFTLGNMFCGYACVVYSMRGEFAVAAMFIGIAIVLDMLDGRVARLTGTSSAFGVEFDSLADVISFGIAPAILSFAWGLTPFGRAGWAAGFLFVSAAAIRLARFNIQTGVPTADKRYFVGMPSPAAAGVPAATVFAYPYGLDDWFALLAFPMVLVPAFLMVSTVRYRSFKTFNLGERRSYRKLIVMALVIAAIATHPQITLVVLAYTYLASAFVGMAWARFGRRNALEAAVTSVDVPAPPAPQPAPQPDTPAAGADGPEPAGRTMSLD